MAERCETRVPRGKPKLQGKTRGAIISQKATGERTGTHAAHAGKQDEKEEEGTVGGGRMNTRKTYQVLHRVCIIPDKAGETRNFRV